VCAADDTPLMCACESGNLELVETLMQDFGADPNRPNKDGMTALHSAAGFNRPDVVKYLLARGAKPTKTDADGQTAHQLASSCASFIRPRSSDLWAVVVVPRCRALVCRAR
jgi:ankyrin repeat protein